MTGGLDDAELNAALEAAEPRLLWGPVQNADDLRDVEELLEVKLPAVLVELLTHRGPFAVRQSRSLDWQHGRQRLFDAREILECTAMVRDNYPPFASPRLRQDLALAVGRTVFFQFVDEPLVENYFGCDDQGLVRHLDSDAPHIVLTPCGPIRAHLLGRLRALAVTSR